MLDRDHKLKAFSKCQLNNKTLQLTANLISFASQLEIGKLNFCVRFVENQDVTNIALYYVQTALQQNYKNIIRNKI